MKPIPITFRVPLVSAGLAAGVLNCSTSEVMQLIECGKILWAWDFASRSARPQFVRILARSLADFQSGQRPPAIPDSAAFAQTLATVFPMVQPVKAGIVATLRATVIAQQLSVSGSHLANLIREGSLSIVKGTTSHSGPDSSPQVEFASVASLLRTHRIP